MSDRTPGLRPYTKDDHVRIAARNLISVYRSLDTHNSTELPTKLINAIERLAEAVQQPEENLLSDNSEPEKAARDAVVQAAVWYVEAREVAPDEALVPGTFILRRSTLTTTFGK
jgi:hypothetical protein